MPKWTAIGNDPSLANVKPEDVPSLYDEASMGIPPKGVYLVNLKRLEATKSKAGEAMMKMVCEIAEPKGTRKAKYNGYSIWNYRTAGPDQAARVNGFLKALMDKKTPAEQKKILTAWHSQNIMLDDNGFIKKIGSWNIPESILVGVNTRLERSEEYSDKLAISEFFPASDAPKSAPADLDEPDEEEEATELEPEEDEEVAERQAELQGMELPALKTVAKALGAKLAEYKALAKAELVEFILDLEYPPLDDEPEDEPEPDEDEEEDEPEDEEEADELEGLSRAELKAHIKDSGLVIRVTTKMTDGDIVAAIRALDEPDDDEEEEPEPVTAKPAGRTRPAAKRRAGKAGDDDPPF